MDLKIKDVAELLSVSETTIRRWLASSKIPAYRIQGQYRFSRIEIEDWVLKHKLGHSTSPHTTSPLAHTTENQKGSKQFSLFRAIHKGGVFKDVPGETKEEVIHHAVKIIAKKLDLDAHVLTDLLLDREKLMPTALNNGIGVPHTRDFLLDTPYDVVTVVFPKNPIEYGALDNKPVNTLFFLLASQDKKHLHLLAKIAHLCSREATRTILETRPEQKQFLEYVKDWETQFKK
jgi:nitrogen PTS system EIIA component